MYNLGAKLHNLFHLSKFLGYKLQIRLQTLVAYPFFTFSLPRLFGFRLFLLGVRQYVAQDGYHLAGMLAVLDVEDVVLLRSLVGVAAFCIGHQVGQFGDLLYVALAVAGRDDAFLVHVDYVVAHHLAATHLTYCRQLRAYEVDEFCCTSHIGLWVLVHVKNMFFCL